MNNNLTYSFIWTSSRNVTQHHAKSNLVPNLELPILTKLLLNACGIGKPAPANLFSSADKFHNHRFFNIFVLNPELRPPG